MKRFLSLALAIIAILSVFTIAAPTEVSAASNSASIREVKNITIFNKATNQAFCHEYQKVGDGVRIWSWQYDGEGNNFNIEKVKDGVYRLVTTVNPSYAIDVNCPGKIRNKNLLKKNLQVDLWKKGGSEGFAQNLIIEACSEEGYYYLRMAENKNLCLASSGKNKRIVLATFTGSNSQKWTFKDAQGKNVVDITTTSTTISNATTGIPASAYKKTGVCYTVNGAKFYEANTIQAYNEVNKNATFFLNSNGKVETNADTLGKLYSLKMLNQFVSVNRSALTSYINLSNEYLSLYSEIGVRNKFGNLIGKSSGTLLSIGSGNAYKLGDVVVDLFEEVASPESLKEACLYHLLQVYTNNAVSCGTQAICLMDKGITKYEDMDKWIHLYAECVASFAAVEHLAGDTLEEMRNSSVLKEVWKYFGNVFTGLADSIIPDFAPAELTKYLTDGVVALSDFAVSSGAEGVYQNKYNEQSSALSVCYVNGDSAKSVADKLTKAETSKFVKALSSKYTTNVTTQKWAAYYSGNGYHLGVDLGTNGNKATDVVSIADGVVYRVVKESKSGGWGNLVIIQHALPNGKVFYSGYAHLKSMSVKEGATVSAGTKLGVMGSTGYSTGPHLHLLCFSGSFSKSSLPKGYVSKKITGDSYTVSGLTYYNPLKVISSNGSIIK